MRSYSYLNCFSKIRANVEFGLNLLLLEAPSKEILTVSRNCPQHNKVCMQKSKILILIVIIFLYYVMLGYVLWEIYDLKNMF